ncbi:MAG: SIS domain-containing protein, partial [Candidatus Saccharibacteria bacterium]|nr:SIS domain-containing protein [Pseudorhodobacter sp.]
MTTITETVIRDQFPFWQAALRQDLPLLKAGTIVVVGCGTSYNLALSLACACNAHGQRAIAVPGAEWARRPDSYLADCRDILVLGLSRSGTTTETVQALQASRARGWPTFALSCAPGAALLGAAHRGVYVPTDPREGIVMSVSASLMLLVGLRLVGLTVPGEAIAVARQGLADMALGAAVIHGRHHFVYLGAGAQYGLATEGSLKLQEMSLSYSQAFHPMEYRHGPVSLIDDGSVVVMLYSADTAAEEASLVAELQAKGAGVIGFGGPGDLRIAATGLAALPALQILGELVALQ